MGFLAGRTTVTTTVQTTATIPAPGNAPANTLADPTASSGGSVTQSLNYGTGSGFVDVFCAGEFAIGPNASLTLNLFDGGATTADLTTVFGAAANLQLVKSLTIGVISGGDASGVRVGGAASNPWAGFWGSTFDIFPAGPAPPFGSPAGAVVSGTAKNLKITNQSTTATVVVRIHASGSSIVPGNWTGFFGLLTYA